MVEVVADDRKLIATANGSLRGMQGIRWNGAPIDLIPAEIRRAYDSLAWDVCQLHRKWGIFCRLFASGESVVELLNRSAAGFFRTFEDLLTDDILLSISRLV